jgi:RNA polymerase sigma-70 factor, ECF subfamily
VVVKTEPAHPTAPQQSTEDAFVALVQTHHAIIARVVRYYAHEHADRDDLRQDILGQLWRAFPSFAGRAKLSTWVYRVALNVAISQHRRRRRDDARLVQPVDGALDDVSVDPPEHDERRAALDRFLIILGEFDRALLLLYLADHSHQEIAESLGITATNVSTRLSRLRARFRQATLSSAQEDNDGSR